MDVQKSHFQKAPSSIFVIFLGILMLVIDEFEKANFPMPFTLVGILESPQAATMKSVLESIKAYAKGGTK